MGKRPAAGNAASKTQKKKKPLWRRILRKIGIGALALVLAIAVAFVGIRTFIAVTTRIGTPNGIDTSTYVQIGGIEQFLRIRGEDRSNPVILWLHGGPGNPEALQYYLWQKPLQAEYTIVDWDERGAGNTYYRNGGDCGEVTMGRMVQDIGEIVDYLCETFDKEQVVIAGHSFGSHIGLRYVQAHPEKVSHYIGIGQVAEGYDGDTIEQARKATEIARERGDEAAAAEMERLLQEYLDGVAALQAHPTGGTSEIIVMDPAYATWLTLRTQMYELLPTAGNSDLFIILAGAISPRMTWGDTRWWLGGMGAKAVYQATDALIRENFVGNVSMYDVPLTFETPLTFITGDSDWVTPYTLVEEYMRQIDAPSKELHYVPDAGHSPMWDQPEAFAAIVKTALAS